MAVGVSHGGQSVSASNTRGLFLKVFSGEVMHAYERAIKVSPLLTNRTITSGKSAQFPATGVAVARYHQPGESLLGVDGEKSAGDGSTETTYLSTIKQSERVIFLDNLLTASCFIDSLDEAMTHYDYRAAFATELGRALARHQDNYALYTLFASAKDVGSVADEHTPGAANALIYDDDFVTSPASAVDTIYDCSRILDIKDVPKEDRYVVIPPHVYYVLLKAGVLSLDMHATSDTRKIDGATTRGEPSGTRIAGMPIIVSNSDGFTSGDEADDGAMLGPDGKVPGETIAEKAGIRNLSDGSSLPDGTTGGTAFGEDKLAAIVFHKSAAGVVKLKDLTMESEYMIERQGTLMVAKMAQGMGALRNDGAIAIVDTVS